MQFILLFLPARCSNKSCSSDGWKGGVLLVVVLDAFEPLQVHNTKHGQRQADPKEQQTHIEPPTGKIEKVLKGESLFET